MTKEDNTLRVTLSDGAEIETESVLMAVGREPDTQSLGIQNAGILLGKNKEIIVDENHKTNVDHIYAIGDCINKVNLTPVAIKAGRILAEHLFGTLKSTMDYEFIPTVVFSHPPTIHIGLNMQ